MRNDAALSPVEYFGQRRDECLHVRQREMRGEVGSALTPAAITRTRMLCGSLISGRGTDCSWSTSGPPMEVITIACIYAVKSSLREPLACAGFGSQSLTNNQEPKRKKGR